MTSLTEQIEMLRVRMNEFVTSEQGHVRALGDALGEADHKLLEEVRNLGAQHELRRAAILKELQGLAARMCALPAAQNSFGILENHPNGVMLEESLEPDGADWHRAGRLQEELSTQLIARRAR